MPLSPLPGMPPSTFPFPGTDPTQGGSTPPIVPWNPYGNNSSVTANGSTFQVQQHPTIYEIFLALFVLFLIMKFVPNGVWIGGILLLGVLLSTQDIGKGFDNLLTFITKGISQ